MTVDEMLSDFQKSNLRKLSKYLRGGHLTAEFDMGCYCEEAFPITVDGTCGSVGCAVGHGPYAGIPWKGETNWPTYSDNNLVDSDNYLWGFLFSSDWEDYDNTPEGAADRIDFVLDNLTMEDEEFVDLLPWMNEEVEW